MIKEETIVTLANEGMHNQKGYVKMKAMLTDHSFINPRLYHLVLTGSDLAKDYQAAMKALCFELRRQDIPHEWKACIEDDPDKGTHFHTFILTESKYTDPSKVLNGNKGYWFSDMMARRELGFHIAKPQSPIHRNKKGKMLNYATLAGDKLQDCLVWISYLVKRRSKSEYMSHIYFGSRPSRRKVSEQSNRVVDQETVNNGQFSGLQAA